MKLGVCLFHLFTLVSSLLIGSSAEKEPAVHQGQLENGVLYWIHPYTSCEHMTTIKVIWKVEEQIDSYGTEIPYADTEELISFFEFCRDKIHPQSESVGIIVVGDFNGDDVHQACEEAFSEIGLNPLKERLQGVHIGGKPDCAHVEVSLYYPTPLLESKSLEGLKKQWRVFFLQRLLTQKVQQMLYVSNAVSIPAFESNFCLPGQGFVFRAQCGLDNCLKVLSTYLAALRDIKKTGIDPEEFVALQKESEKKIESLLKSPPAAAFLTNYYTDQFILGMKLPDYKSYATMSQAVVRSLLLKEVEETLGELIQEENRTITVVGPLQIEESRKQLLEIASGVFTGSGFDNDPFASLPVTEEERKHIRYIIETVGKTSAIMLPFHAETLEDLGQRVQHVHPLRFLETIFVDPYLKKCMASIRDSFFKWRNFLAGFSKRIEEEHANDHVIPYLMGFCKRVKADPDQVRVLVQKKQWEALVAYLIEGS